MHASTTQDSEAEETHDEAIRAISDALRGLRFGSVTVVVQDGLVIQVERLEKKRIARPPRRNPA